MLLAIDPGTGDSAYVGLTETGQVIAQGIMDNDEFLQMLERDSVVTCNDRIVIEMVASYGMPVGRETFETCVWIGRFIQAVAPHPVERMTRNEVKMQLCHHIAKVNDGVLRQALIDRYGPGKEKAIGNKKSPGPLYGIKSHLWAALALGVAALERKDTHHASVVAPVPAPSEGLQSVSHHLA